MEEPISVEPNDIVRACVKAVVRLNNFVLNAKECDATVEKYDANTRIIEVVSVHINEEEYAQWGFDDNYIVGLALSKAGLTAV